ncbi:hypothetical protein EVJ50_11445 [Synechococcus sp. RSCCF101]|uniref:hypothetical protein n=1 Tax=Synechococcus sp. RSCCF101 TaxID=2511069 RepID=UPI0012439CB5|nr:hypothetical protein [Synechococcus sp. RSCCF101]QEY32750.1 hypothetical protein EVJ50_11445 [Synechococcus sp. RSCCF101]
MPTQPPAGGSDADRRPEAAELLALEERARREGLGLHPGDLVGVWCLEQVWPKGATSEPRLTGALLRRLGARLELSLSPDAAGEPLRVANAVALGPLQLRFAGWGRLQGRRPLLLFGFEGLSLLWGRWTLLSRSLATPTASDGTGGVRDGGVPKGQPFFALIGGGRREGWLAARGRGGGLARWVRRGDPPDPA